MNFTSTTPRLVVHMNYEPMLIAADIEHHAIVCDETRRAVLRLDVIRCFPSRLPSLSVPGFEGLFSILAATPGPIGLERTFGDHSHNNGLPESICQEQ